MTGVRRTVLVAALVALLTVVPATASTNAPPGFAQAVADRVALLTGNASQPVSQPTTFAQLQQAAESAAAETYDPSTGEHWDVPTLLQRASGQSTWLGDDVADQDRETQLRQVFALLTWRGIRLLSSETPYAGRFVASDQLSPGNHCYDQAGAAEAASLFGPEGQRVPSLPASDFSQITLRSDARIELGMRSTCYGPTDTAMTTLIRLVVAVPAPVSPAAGGPMANVPVNGAELIGSVGTRVPVVPIAASIASQAAGYLPTAADAESGGTSLGDAKDAGQSVGDGYCYGGGCKNMIWQVDPATIEVAGSAANPVFQPTLVIRFQQDPEPAAGWPVYPSANSPPYTAQDFVPVYLIYNEQLGPLTVGPTHIGTVSLTFLDRQKRLAAAARAQFDQLSAGKQAVETEIAAARQQVSGEQAELDRLDGEISKLGTTLDDARRYLRELAALEKHLPDSVKAELAARESLELAIIKTEDEILGARAAGDRGQAAALEPVLANERSQLATLDRSLAPSEAGYTKVQHDFVSRMRIYEREVFALRERRADAQRAQFLALGTLQHAVRREAELDAGLLALQQTLSNLDFAVEHVTVAAGGTTVFAADLASPLGALDDVNAELDLLTPKLAALLQSKTEINDSYVQAAKLAQAKLKAVGSIIASNAWLKAGIDTADYAYDVSKGFGQGGPIGALGAALKKGVEGYIANRLDPGTSGAPELDVKFKADEKALWVTATDKTVKLSAARLAKDWVGGTAKDRFNQSFLAFYEGLYKTVPSFYSQGGPMPPSSPDSGTVRKLIDGFTKWQKWSKTRQDALEKLRKGPGALELKKMAFSFAKDVAKALGKAALDHREQVAWANYAEADVIAREWFTAYQDADTEYRQAYQLHEGLKAYKALLESRYDPNSKLHIVQDDQFDSSLPLTVALQVRRASGATETLTLGATIAGQAATPGAQPNAFTLTGADLTPGPNGLGLVITAK